MFGTTIVLRKKKKRNRKNFYYFVPIIFIIIFSIAISSFVKKEEMVREETKADSIEVFKEINDYSLYYIPVVMNNFFNYKKGDLIDNETLIKMSIMSIICTEDVEQYEVFDGEIILPAQVLAERAEKLFSKDVNIKNSSIKSENFEVEYNKENDLYIIPIVAFLPEYAPVLESVAVKNKETVLTIGCLKSDSFKQDSSGNTVIPEADKRIILTLIKENNEFYISGVSEE